MKKVLSILLVAILAFSALPLVANAAGDPAFSLTSVSGKAGDSVQVVLSIDNNPGITNFDISVAFDANSLELTSKKANNKTVGKLTLSAGTDMGSPQKVIFNDGTDNVEDNGTLVTYTFTIKEGAKTSDVTVSAVKVSKLDNPEAEDGKMTDIKGSFAYNKGTVTVEAAAPTEREAFEQAVADKITASAADTSTFKPANGFTNGLELVGAQEKAATNGARFITAISKDVLNNTAVKDYGYIFIQTSAAPAQAKIDGLTPLTVKPEKKFSCKGTTCTYKGVGDFGDPSKGTDYTYVTCAINNIKAGKFITCKFYVETEFGTTYYDYAKTASGANFVTFAQA